MGKVCSPPPSEGIHPALSEETVMASSEVAAVKANATSAQDLLFAPRPVTRFKSQQVPKGEVQNVIHEEGCHTPKELLKFSNLYKQKSGGSVWKWTPRVWDNDRRNGKSDEIKCILIDSLSRDSTFSVASQGVRMGSNSRYLWMGRLWFFPICWFYLPFLVQNG